MIDFANVVAMKGPMIKCCDVEKPLSSKTKIAQFFKIKTKTMQNKSKIKVKPFLQEQARFLYRTAFSFRPRSIFLKKRMMYKKRVLSEFEVF